MEQIMIVEDEQDISDLLRVYLTNEGYAVTIFSDAEAALAHLREAHVDLALVDIMLPGMDGLTLSQTIRTQHMFPIILLTAKDDALDKISGLSVGADDYMTKPFHPLEVVARVKAQLRRYKHYNQASGEAEEVVFYNNLVLNRSTYECLVNERPVSLTPLEFKILWELVANAGKVMATETLFERVWGEAYYEKDNNTVMVHIRHIRSKIDGLSASQKYIKTIWGVGYKIG